MTRRLHGELFTYIAVEMTVKTYRGTRAKRGATDIKQLITDRTTPNQAVLTERID